MFNDEKCSEKFKIIPPTVEDMRKWLWIEECNESHPADITKYEPIEDIELYVDVFFPDIPNEYTRHNRQYSFFVESNIGDAYFVL